MKLPVVTVHLENGTSHSFEVADVQQVLLNFKVALERQRECFWVGTHTVFQTNKVTHMTLAKAGARG